MVKRGFVTPSYRIIGCLHRVKMTTSACNPPLFEFKYNVRRRNHLGKVKRSLFGPVDHEYNKRFLAEQLRVDHETFASKYNFDFVKEKQIDPRGDFVWEDETTTVQINRKRKIGEAILEDTSSLMYFKPIEPVASLPESNFNKTNLTTVPKQSLITDFMAKSKRSTTTILIKETSDERPTKISKLGDCSS